MDPLAKRKLSRTGLVHSNLLLPPVHGVGIVYLKEPLKDAEIHLHNARKALYELEKTKGEDLNKHGIDNLETKLRDAMVKLEESEKRHFKERFGNRCVSGWYAPEGQENDGADDDGAGGGQDDDNSGGGGSGVADEDDGAGGGEDDDNRGGGSGVGDDGDGAGGGDENDNSGDGDKDGTEQFFATEPADSSFDVNNATSVTGDLTFETQVGEEKKTIKIGPRDQTSFFENVGFNSKTIAAYMTLLGGEGNPRRENCIFLPPDFFTDYTGRGKKVTEGESNSDVYASHTKKDQHNVVATWTKNLNTTDTKTRIFIPVRAEARPDETGNSLYSTTKQELDHWYLIMIDVRQRLIWSFDSLAPSGDNLNLTEPYRGRDRDYMLDRIQTEHKSKNITFNRDFWSKFTHKVPAQTNKYDGGPFTCMFAAFLSNDRKMEFGQKDMPQMRKRIAWSIFNQRLTT